VRQNFNLGIGFTLTCFMLTGFYSIIFAHRRLMRPGVSAEMRKLFFKKHVIYVFVLNMLQMCTLINNYHELFRPVIVTEEVSFLLGEKVAFTV
jgi:hypothetical protein